jgi:phosphate transport system substrate-binding protein
VTPLGGAFSNVKLSPAAGGSGKGVTDATNGISQMGGSDAYLTNAELSSGLANVAIAVSAQDMFYNLPGVSNLKLSGSVLSQMYQGKITTWSDAAVAKLNPGVKLPSTKVIPVHRADSSGDTFLFTGFLSRADASGWGASSGPGQGTTVTWPSVASAQTASGNPGMVAACKASPGCVAYVGISAQKTAQSVGLGEAALQDQAGDFVTADATTINNAVGQSAGSVGSNLVANLLYATGAMSYPIVNFEYIVVKSKQADPTTALAIRDFLSFAISPTGGSAPALLAKDNFQPLPSSVLPKVNAAIAAIQ